MKDEAKEIANSIEDASARQQRVRNSQSNQIALENLRSNLESVKSKSELPLQAQRTETSRPYTQFQSYQNSQTNTANPTTRRSYIPQTDQQQMRIDDG